MKQILLLFLLLCGVQAKSSPFLKETDLQLGYFGKMVTHPGIQIGGEQTFFSKRVVSIHLREEFFFYRHRRNHDMLGFQIELPVKIPTERRFSGELFGGVGYLIKLTNSDAVYSRNSSGPIEEKSRVAMHRFSLNTGLAFNASVIHTNRFLLGTYLRPTLFWEYPYNGTFLLHPALALGISFDFSGETKE